LLDFLCELDYDARIYKHQVLTEFSDDDMRMINIIMVIIMIIVIITC